MKANNSQRKAWASVATARISAVRQAIHEINNNMSNEITEKIKTKLGVQIIDKEISSLEAKLTMLNKKREDIAGNRVYGSFARDSKAQKVKDNLMQMFDVEVRDINLMESSVIAEMWAVTTTEEAFALLRKIEDVQKKYNQKLDELKPGILAELEGLSQAALT